MAPDYSKGKIYKIVNDVDEEVYVGSTVQPLCARLAEHKRKSKQEDSRKCYNHWNGIGWDTVKIILVEDFPCERKEQLEARERYWIEQIGTLNKNIPTRCKNEYREANKDVIIEKKKQYYVANKDYLKEKNKKYREEHNDKDKNSEYFKKYNEANKDTIKERKKQYREVNKDEIKEKKKQYYEANKDAINAKQREKREKKKFVTI